MYYACMRVCMLLNMEWKCIRWDSIDSHAMLWLKVKVWGQAPKNCIDFLESKKTNTTCFSHTSDVFPTKLRPKGNVARLSALTGFLTVIMMKHKHPFWNIKTERYTWLPRFNFQLVVYSLLLTKLVKQAS